MQRVLHQLILLLILGMVLLGACQGALDAPAEPISPLAAAESPLAAVESPLAAARQIGEGKALVVGRLFAQATGQPLNNVVVRLAEIYCPEGIEILDKSEECFWALDNAFSPSTFTDETGYFEFVDAEARDYALLVGDLIGKYAFLKHPNDKQVIITALPDQVTDVGDQQLDY
jgi:hypothetical protein